MSCKKEECKRVVRRCIDTSTPIKIEVSPVLGGTSVSCGRPRLCWCRCRRVCRKNSVEFTVHQTLLVEIPITYNVSAEEGGTRCGS